MNFNAIIAVLILKSVITEDEGERLVKHLNDKPQSTVLRDAIAAVAEIIGKPQPAFVHPAFGPVGPAQIQEEIAARAAVPVPTTPEVSVEPIPTEPEIAAADPVLDIDQAEEKPSDTETEDKPASDEPAKVAPVNKKIGVPGEK